MGKDENLGNEKFAAGLVAELLDANEAALAVLTAAVADVVGRDALRAALERQLGIARAAVDHPTRDGLLGQALQGLKPPH